MLQALYNLFYPAFCLCCESALSRQDALLCTRCLHELPLTHFHHYNDDSIKKVLYGRVTLEYATALFHYSKKSAVQQLIHQLKYKGQEQVSAFLGEWLGNELKNEEAYQGIDLVIPVPLHPSKRRQRGYNQVSGFGQEIAKALKIDYREDVLVKKQATGAQALKARFNRSGTLLHTFEVPEVSSLAGKHLLLVDDLITTGATVEACARALSAIPDLRLSLATMAMAR
ncbi:ComF family protein [Croceiramulus getboli]|nr:phosphoribosyltransferase family protein [Flavobacteriaceae bacterium YJPT1-3]